MRLICLGAVEDEVCRAVEMALEDAFGFEVLSRLALPEPDHAYDANRGQYSSVAILRDLVARPARDCVRVLAVTEKDLFIPMLSFIYGQAQLGGFAALLSLARLRQEFYGLPPDEDLLRERAIVEALHEMGHTFRLVHCRDSSCAMALSTNIEQLDLKRGAFCGACRLLLRESIAEVRRASFPAGEFR
jgi:archaemetzincin